MKTYLDTLRSLVAEGEAHDDRTGVGTLRKFGHLARYDLTGWRLPILTTRKMNLKVIATELEWFIKGLTDVKWLNERGVKIWDVEAWMDERGRIGPNYGFQWRHFGGNYDHIDRPATESTAGGFDQLKDVCEKLQEGGRSRRILLTTWDPSMMYRIPLPPCIVLCQFSVDSSGGLSCMMTQRSCDYFVGGPHDIAQYALLTMLLAYTCKLEPRELIHSVGDIHLYRNHVEAANRLLGREPFPSPKVHFTWGMPNGSGIIGMDCFAAKHVGLEDYRHHSAIKVEVAE